MKTNRSEQKTSVEASVDLDVEQTREALCPGLIAGQPVFMFGSTSDVRAFRSRFDSPIHLEFRSAVPLVTPETANDSSVFPEPATNPPPTTSTEPGEELVEHMPAELTQAAKDGNRRMKQSKRKLKELSELSTSLSAKSGV